jgi:hypothetical protein
MLLFDIAQAEKMFSDRQAAAFRLYLNDPRVRRRAHDTLLAHHQETLRALAMPKPPKMGYRCLRSCLDDRSYRFRQALTALADGCLPKVKVPFLAVNNHSSMEPVWSMT